MPKRVPSSGPPVVLIAVDGPRPLLSVLEENGYAVVQGRTGADGLEWPSQVQPDAVILDARVTRATGVDLCRSLLRDPRVGRRVPIFILTPDEPASDHRIAALRAGAWYCLRRPGDPDELLLKLRNYVQAKRETDRDRGEALFDPMTGLHSRQGLARRARELGTLMSRQHGALACVVFALEIDPAAPKAAKVVALTVEALKSAGRVSDVIAALGPAEFAVLAPATDHDAAVRLAQRMARALQTAVGAAAPASTVRVGYDAVANLSYTPIDPMELLARATAALRSGKPEPRYPWVRRFDPGVESG